jgi:hypothetical protein
MHQFSSSLQALADTLQWRKIVKVVETAGHQSEALEAACEAKGYLKCLYDVGLIGIFQRKQMEAQLEEVCSRHEVHKHVSHMQRLARSSPS